MPIKVKDFGVENSVTRKYMFHPHVFSYEPTFRFKTIKLLMLGFLMCSHRDDKHARDSLWGLINPTIKQKVKRDHLRDFLM